MYMALSSHELVVFLLQAGVLLGAALLLGRLAARAGLPAVVGELCAGIVLGPSLLGRIEPGIHSLLTPVGQEQSHLIDATGQVGVLLLVGLSATQLDFALIRRDSAIAMRVGAAGLIVPFALGIGTGFLLPASLIGSGGDHDTFAFFFGVAMAVSALPVIAKTLLDMGLLHRNIGQLTLATSVIDDTAGWLLLSAVSAFVTIRPGGRAGYIIVALVSLVSVVAGAGLVGRPLARRLHRRLDRASDPVYVGIAVTLMLLAAAGTGSLGLEPLFGAFMCGLVLASADDFNSSRLKPLRAVVMGFLAPLFFATAGLRMNVGALRSPVLITAAACTLLVAVVGKFAGAYMGASLSRLSRWEAVALGAGLNSRGVIQIVTATVGLSVNVLTTASYTIIVLVAIVTSTMAAPVLRVATRHIDWTEEEELRARSLLGDIPEARQVADSQRLG